MVGSSGGSWVVVHGTGNSSLLFSQLESLVGFLGYVYPMKSGEKFIKKTDSTVKRIVAFRHQLVLNILITRGIGVRWKKIVFYCFS